jgi:hypothetical protein
MYLRSVAALQADALFASAVQHGDEPDISQVRRAIALALDAYGGTGCAGRVAQEFGDHPDTAALRMRWARAAVRDLNDQSIPRTRRIAAPDRRDGGGIGRDWRTLLLTVRSRGTGDK